MIGNFGRCIVDNNTDVLYTPLGYQMMFRIVIFALVTVALNVAAIAHCRVGGMAMAAAGLGEIQSATHEHQSDCGKQEKRVCDAMVQLTAPDKPAVASALGKPLFAPVSGTQLIVVTPVLALSQQRWHPPPTGGRSSFKAIHARTGRLLV